MALDLDKSETAETFLREIRYLPTPPVVNENPVCSKIDVKLAQTIKWDQSKEVCYENLIITRDINDRGMHIVFNDSLSRAAGFELLSILHQVLPSNNSSVISDLDETNILIRETDGCAIDVVFTVADRQKVIRVLGVSHIGDLSTKDVERHILQDFKPDAIVLEWDEERLDKFQSDSRRCCSRWCNLFHNIFLDDYLNFGEKLLHLKAAIMNYHEVGHELFHAASLARRKHLDLVFGDSLFWHGYANASKHARKSPNPSIRETRLATEKRIREKLDQFRKHLVRDDTKQSGKHGRSTKALEALDSTDGHDEEAPFVAQYQTITQTLEAVRNGEVNTLEAAIRIEALTFAESSVSELDHLRGRNAELVLSALFGFFNGDDDRCLIVTGWAHMIGIIEVLMDVIQEKSSGNDEIGDWIECYVAIRRSLRFDEPKFAKQALQFTRKARKGVGSTFLVRFFLTTPFLQALIKVAGSFGEEDLDIARIVLDLVHVVLEKWDRSFENLLSWSSLARLIAVSQQLREAHENDEQVQSVASRIIDIVNKLLSSM